MHGPEINTTVIDILVRKGLHLMTDKIFDLKYITLQIQIQGNSESENNPNLFFNCSFEYQAVDYNIPDALRPDVFVESGVHTNIRGTHHLLSKLADLLNCTGCPPLESTTNKR